jgi:hypothetical protein
MLSDVLISFNIDELGRIRAIDNSDAKNESLQMD